MPIGTRVRLASGGPVMVVVGWDETDREYVVCAWDGPDGPQEHRFRIVTLDVVRRKHVL